MDNMTLLLLPLMVVAFYFLLIRPQRKRAQQQQKLLAEMQPGERVVTHSGIFGTLVSSGTKQSVLQIAPGLEITVLKQAIARVVRAEDEDGLVELEDEDTTDDQTGEVENLESTETNREYDAYRPGDPSSLDLPDLDPVDQQTTPQTSPQTTPPSTAPTSPVASTPDSSTVAPASTGESQPGIRDVTSSYLKRPEPSTPETSEPGYDTESETGRPTKDS